MDPVIQFPANSQSMNPYSYLMNNPLWGTDPSGYAGCQASAGTRIKKCAKVTKTYSDGRQSSTRTNLKSAADVSELAADIGNVITNGLRGHANNNGSDSQGVNGTNTQPKNEDVASLGSSTSTQAANSAVNKHGSRDQTLGNAYIDWSSYLDDLHSRDSIDISMVDFFNSDFFDRPSNFEGLVGVWSAINQYLNERNVFNTIGLMIPRFRSLSGRNQAAVVGGRKYWINYTNFRGNRVYQRNDLIDPRRVDPASGMTNLQLMKAGRSPLGPDMKPINVHHLTQRQKGALAEVTETFHTIYRGIIHINHGTKTPSGINRSAFNTWRRNYWKNRAKDFE